MDFEKVVYDRRSSRGFTDQKISNEVLNKIVETAQQAPSWVNSQPVRVRIATGKTLDKICQQHGELNEDPMVHTDSIIPYRSVGKWDQESQKNMNAWFEGNIMQVGIDWSNLLAEAASHLYNAQAVVYLTLPKDYSEWSLVDLGSFAQTLILAATNAGLGTLPAFEFVKYPEPLAKNLDLPADRLPIFGIGLGYVDDADSLNKIHTHRMQEDEILKILD
ncbi:nitroreductase family protein [Eupransor demetentiae]|uniref:Nitroreductase (NfnB) n=1 Tax=Eupransor demetentiae TaxID=3109584 RepID=A0ABM9N406_9LACO|nr:Nitroreductase (NfnB) [Lactobacillaceae bacterium LMG 33000]